MSASPTRSQPMTSTPPPWHADPDDREGYEWNIHILDVTGINRICFMSNGPQSEANATLIVDAVNSHETLKARIQELTEAMQFIADGYDNHDVNHVDYRVTVYQVALAALQPKESK